MKSNTRWQEGQDAEASRERARGRGEEEDDEEYTPKLRLINSSSSSSERLRFFGDDEALIRALVEELDVAEVEAVRAIGRFGLIRCEGAVLKTMNTPGLQSPAGWFFSSLGKQLEWTAKEVELYAQRYGVSGGERGRSIEVEWGRWATFLIRGERPPNYSDWLPANRERYDAELRRLAGSPQDRSE